MSRMLACTLIFSSSLFLASLGDARADGISVVKSCENNTDPPEHGPADDFAQPGSPGKRHRCDLNKNGAAKSTRRKGGRGTAVDCAL